MRNRGTTRHGFSGREFNALGQDALATSFDARQTAEVPVVCCYYNGRGDKVLQKFFGIAFFLPMHATDHARRSHRRICDSWAGAYATSKVARAAKPADLS